MKHLFLVSCVLFATPAFSQTSAPVPQTPAGSALSTDAAAPSPADDPNEIVCRHLDAPTGSRLPGPTVCRTREVWNEIARNSQQMVHDFQKSGGQQPQLPPGTKAN